MSFFILIAVKLFHTVAFIVPNDIKTAKAQPNGTVNRHVIMVWHLKGFAHKILLTRETANGKFMEIKSKCQFMFMYASTFDC